jgi:hypothetical protein
MIDGQSLSLLINDLINDLSTMRVDAQKKDHQEKIIRRAMESEALARSPG